MTIFPKEDTAGGVVVRDPFGNPISDPEVHNAYVPPPEYAISCPLTALPTNCDARIEPEQINAIVSELLSFAECLDPDGPWDCTKLSNLCKAFLEWADLLDGGTFEGTVSPTTRYMHHRTSDPIRHFPETVAEGEIVVNTANLQIAVGDAGTVTPGVPLPLLTIRFWTTRAQYAAGDFVIFGGKIYRALEDIEAGGPFNPVQWYDVVGIDLGAPADDGKLYGLVSDGTGYVWTEAVNRAGDAMLGPLLLLDEIPRDPLAAVPKQWVDKIPIAFPVVGKPIAATSIYIPIVIPMTIPELLDGTMGFASVAATVDAVFTLNRIASGGVVTPLGTITAPAGSKTNFTLAGTGGTLAMGEVLQLTAPAVQDITLADVGITLTALRA